MQATTNVANSQGSLGHCCNAERFGRRTDGRPALLKAANGTDTFDSRAFVTVVLAEDEREAGKDEDRCLALLMAGLLSVTARSSSSAVLAEDA